MSVPRKTQVARQKREARREIVAELYRKGYSIRQICKEVKRRLDLTSCSTKSIHDDIQALLTEWREARIEDTDQAIQLELARIDNILQELWAQWEKSKQDFTRTEEKRRGAPNRGRGANGEIRTVNVERIERQVVNIGDVAIMAEIRKQLAERRKLLGLYAPERRELTGANGQPLEGTKVAVDISGYSDEVKAQLLELARNIEPGS
jgi:hypothetical protein